MQFRQKPNENVDDFVTRCKTLALKCEFKEHELQERILELLIASTPFESFQHDLLVKPKGYELPLALEETRRYEAISGGHIQIKGLTGSTTADSDIHTVKKKNYKSCPNCGLNHKPKKCPAYFDECRYCGAKSHWESMCRKAKRDKTKSRYEHNQKRGRSHSHHGNEHRRQQYGNRHRQQIHEIETNEQEEVAFSYHGITVSDQCMDSIDKTVRDSAYTELKVQVPNIKGTHNLKLKIDTGASGNTLPIRTYHQMFGDKPFNQVLKPVKNITLSAYNGQTIHCVGSIILRIKFQQPDFIDALFYVVNVPGPAIVGLPTCEALKLVTINCDEVTMISYHSVDDVMKHFPTQFDSIGDFKTKAKLILKPDAEPYCDPPRKCSIHLKQNIREELEKMKKCGVIRPVTEHTDWCSSLTYVKKSDGSLIICIDPYRLNQALKRCPTKVPTLEELNPTFAQAKFFSKLDAKAGYWSVHLDEDSQLLTTFRTPFGRYCWMRLPFGLTVSQDIFQQQMTEILEGLPCVIGITDDVCVIGKTEEEHDKNLTRLMLRAKDRGLVEALIFRFRFSPFPFQNLINSVFTPFPF